MLATWWKAEGRKQKVERQGEIGTGKRRGEKGTDLFSLL